jgi:hypothetical protein
LAPGKRGLKRGLAGCSLTVIVMLDETIVTETPPLYCCYGQIGEQVRVPISGEHAKRVLHEAINVRSGDLALLITEDWDQDAHEAFLRSVRAHWRGWNLVSVTVWEGFSRTFDTAGEFARGVGGCGLPPPGEPILPSLRRIGGGREFASSITFDGATRCRRCGCVAAFGEDR